MQAQDDSRLVLLYIFLISIEEYDEQDAVHSHCRLDYIRQITFARLFVEEGQILAAVLGMLPQVEVSTIGNAFEFAPAEGILVFDIRTGLGVVGKIVLLVVMKAEVGRLDTEPRGVPIHALLAPILEPLLVSAGLDEELHLHLLELARAENEVTGGDLVAERFADLRDAERRFEAAGLLDVKEIHEHALCSLGAKECHGCVFLNRTDEGFEHQVELPGLGQIALHAFGALPFFLGRNLVSAKAPFANTAVHQWIRKSSDMT